MLGTVKRFFYHFTEEARQKRRHQEMVNFLSQAYDRAHLEHLENQWFKKNGYM